MLTIENYNGKEKKEFAFDVDLKQVKEWCKAIDIAGRCVPIKAVGSHKSKYGFSVFAITPTGIGINLPKFEKEVIDAILADETACKEIKEGKVAMKIEPYTTKSGYNTCRVTFVEYKHIECASVYPTIPEGALKKEEDLPF